MSFKDEKLTDENLTSLFEIGEHGVSVVECRTLSERSGVRNLPPLCCVLEQGTLLPKSTC